MSIKMKLTGFDELLKDIEKAGGSIKEASTTCMKKSAEIMQESLKSEMQEAGVDGGLIQRMPPYMIGNDGNIITAYVGYDKGNYDPKNPSDGYKVVFLNYGTPKGDRKVNTGGQHINIGGKWITLGTNRGKVEALGFIQNAKKKANSQIKKTQEQTLKDILGELR